MTENSAGFIAARVARQAAHEPARPRQRGGNLAAPSEFSGKRAAKTFARHGASSCRPAGHPAQGTKSPAARRRLRAAIWRAKTRRPVTRSRQGSGSAGAQGPRAQSGHRARSALAHGRRQLSDGAVACRHRRSGLLAPPVNVLRLSLHPKGLASRIVNLFEWRSHLIERLRRQLDATGDPGARGTGARAAGLSVRTQNAARAGH